MATRSATFMVALLCAWGLDTDGGCRGPWGVDACGPRLRDRAGRGRHGVQLFHHRSPKRQHRALVDRALVGEFPGVERGRIIYQDDAGEAPRAAAGLLIEDCEKGRERLP